MKKHTLNRFLLLTLALIVVCSAIAKPDFKSSRPNLYPTELYPPQTIQVALAAIFTKDFIEKITSSADLTEEFKRLGFTKVYQYLPNDPKSVIAVEHPSVPGYVLKFSANPDLELYFASKKSNSLRQWGSLKMRVENARHLRNIIGQDKKLGIIKIPRKYLFYAHNFPIVIAEKVILPATADLRNMNFSQLTALLSLVEQSNGILDLKPKNILFDGTNIYLIDTERIQQRTRKALQAILKPSSDSLKSAINPDFVPCLQEWYNNLDKPHTAEIVCPIAAQAA